jgi:hypothetical protein
LSAVPANINRLLSGMLLALFITNAGMCAPPALDMAVLAEPPEIAAGAPPAALVTKLKLSPFYKKYLPLGHFPIVASEHVSNGALWAAREIVSEMLGERPDLLDTLTSANIRLAVMGRGEVTVDIPEHSDLQPAAFWNQRARGLGPTLSRPAISCAEENLFRQPGDRYAGESICVHEFSHAIALALSLSSPGFVALLGTRYRSAMAAGLWKSTYAAENPSEYWAEGVQSYFDANQAPDGSHNAVRTREQLAAYDPALFALIDEVLARPKWRWRR